MFVLVVRVFLVLVFMVMFVRARRDAVARVVTACGEADEAAVADPRKTGGGTVGLLLRVGQSAVSELRRGFAVLRGVSGFFGADMRGLSVGGDAQVVVGSSIRVEMPGDGAGTAFEEGSAVFAFVHRAVADFRASASGAAGLRGKDAMVDHVDDTADGVAAVEKGGGAADDFDAIDEQRIERGRVIRAGGGGIDRANPVFENADAVAAESADHGAARARAEICGRDAGLAGEGFAERGLEFLREKTATEDGGRRGDRGLRSLERRGGNDEIFERDRFIGGGMRMRRRRRGLAVRARGGQKE